MTHAPPNCPKLKLPLVMVVQVCTVNGPTGQFAVKNVPVEFHVASNTTTVVPIQSSKNAPVVLTDGLIGRSGQNAVQHVPELDPDSKLISVALNQSLKPKIVAVAVHSLTGHHGVFAVKNVLVVSHPDHVSINVVSFLRNNPNHAVEQVIMVSGLPGANAMTPMVILSFAEAVCVGVLEVDSVEISMKFKISNVTLNDAVTTVPGLLGLVAVPHVVPVFKNEPLMIATVWSFKSIDKYVPMLLLLVTGLNGVLAVLNVVTVSWLGNAMTHVTDVKNR